MPKLQGVPYFEAMNAGGQKAAAALGNVQWLYQGPTQADAAAQADIVRSFIQQKVNTLIVAPNDPDSMAPLLQEAKAQGIHVATADTDAPNSVREAFVNQATAQGIGESLTDALLKPMGGQGKYAIVSCGQTAENLNSWIKVQKEYTATKYPQAQIVDTVYAGEDQAKATQMATDLMNAHPDLTGLVGECTSSAPGVAQAVQDANKIGKVFTVGLGTPQSMKPYLAKGSSSAAILWNVENLGYLTAWTGAQLAQDKPFADDQRRQRRRSRRSSTTRRARRCSSARRWRSPRTTSTSSTTDPMAPRHASVEHAAPPRDAGDLQELRRGPRDPQRRDHASRRGACTRSSARTARASPP